LINKAGAFKFISKCFEKLLSLKFSKSDSEEKKIYEITYQISKRIEEWITDTPEQWLWAHRRWGK